MTTTDLIVANKIDLPRVRGRDDAPPCRCRRRPAPASTQLRERDCATALDVEPRRDRPAITNVRHIALVRARARGAERARAARPTAGALSEEFVLADLQEARAALEEITGRRTPEDLLAHIFARFCIGK